MNATPSPLSPELSLSRDSQVSVDESKMLQAITFRGIYGKSGYLIAAFSGGPSELDLKVPQAGLEVLADKL